MLPGRLRHPSAGRGARAGLGKRGMGRIQGRAHSRSGRAIDPGAGGTRSRATAFSDTRSLGGIYRDLDSA
jgi:hypothetical protein